jgi:hypothetical protein
MIRKIFVALIALVALTASADTRRSYAGRPLVEVIAELQHRGLTIIYSTDLVKPTMKVAEEPTATSDRAVLDEILVPHGLGVKETSSGVLSIVRADRKQQDVARRQAGPPEEVAGVTLGSIVVTASNYSVMGSNTERRDFLTRQELNRTAHLGDDLFRALSQLPGAAATDLSAAFSVRGGMPSESLVVLDGLEIADPFHIKYFQNAISIIDSDAIGSLDYLSGGFPVEYGGAMSGVIDMTTTSAQKQHHTSAGISFTHARLVTDGTFDGDRGDWLVSARRGYFDLLLGVFYPDIKVRPRYGDVIAKVDERIGDRSALSANLIAATDHVDYDRPGDRINASYESAYGWLNLRTSWSPRLASQMLASFSRLRQKKSGDLDTREEFGIVDDKRDFDITGIKQDWTYDRSDVHQFFKAGIDWKHFDTRYDYSMEAFTFQPLLLFPGNPAHRTQSVSIAPAGSSSAVYAADRIRIAKSLAIEAGARAEHETWMEGGGTAITPRINVAWTPTETTAIRAAWGEFRQAQRLDDISVEDGETATHPAQRSRQIEIGVEQHLRGLLVRGIAYRRDFSDVRPHYENLYDHDEFFPEVKYDRVRIAPDSSGASGIELLLKDESARPFTWWVSVARSKVVDRFGSEEQPRSWDQPNAASFHVNYHRGSTWNFNFGGTIHSGWPTTEIKGVYDPNGSPSQIVIEAGERNHERLPTYRRVDARVMRSSAFSRGVFRSWIEVTNLLNRRNAASIGGFDINVDPSQRTVQIQPTRSALGWLPSFGFAWEF